MMALAVAMTSRKALASTCQWRQTWKLEPCLGRWDQTAEVRAVPREHAKSGYCDSLEPSKCPHPTPGACPRACRRLPDYYQSSKSTITFPSPPPTFFGLRAVRPRHQEKRRLYLEPAVPDRCRFHSDYRSPQTPIATLCHCNNCNLSGRNPRGGEQHPASSSHSRTNLQPYTQSSRRISTVPQSAAGLLPIPTLLGSSTAVKMHDLRRQALESGKTVSRKARSRVASATSSKANSTLNSPANSRAASRNPSRQGSDDEEYLSDGTAWR